MLRTISSALLATTLALAPASCQDEESPSPDEATEETAEESTDEETDEEAADEEEADGPGVELTTSVEYDWGSAAVEIEEPNGFLQIRVETDETVPGLIAFRDVTARPDGGVDFDLLFTWNVAEPSGEIYHSSLLVESGGERYTTGEEDVFTSYMIGEANEFTLADVASFPDAPESGAILFQGISYDTSGTGLPPIGVCYQAGVGFDLESCL